MNEFSSSNDFLNPPHGTVAQKILSQEWHQVPRQITEDLILQKAKHFRTLWNPRLWDCPTFRKAGTSAGTWAQRSETTAQLHFTPGLSTQLTAGAEGYSEK